MRESRHPLILSLAFLPVLSADEFQLENPQLSDYLQRYLPEFNDEHEREKLIGLAQSELIDLLIRAYKERRALAKLVDEQSRQLQRLRDVLDEPSKLVQMPDVPGSDDIRRIMED
jgi:hypothetical protein